MGGKKLTRLHCYRGGLPFPAVMLGNLGGVDEGKPGLDEGFLSGRLGRTGVVRRVCFMSTTLTTK